MGVEKVAGPRALERVCCCISQFTPTMFFRAAASPGRKGALSVHTRVIHVVKCILFVSGGACGSAALLTQLLPVQQRDYYTRKNLHCVTPRPDCFIAFIVIAAAYTFELAGAHREITDSALTFLPPVLMYESYLHVAHWHARAFSAPGEEISRKLAAKARIPLCMHSTALFKGKLLPVVNHYCHISSSAPIRAIFLVRRARFVIPN
jgi:hypothetical protein